MQKSKVKSQNYNSKLKTFKFYLLLLPFYFYLFTFFGCATAPYVPPTPAPGAPGTYHRVERGQTLWRISKMYNLDLEELARLNRISDAAAIEAGQLIFIPGQRRAVPLSSRQAGDDFIWPVKGRVIATFGQTYRNMLNKGINIQPYNNLSVSAARAGRVIFYDENFGNFGKTIIIEHSDGLSSVYARNAEVFVKTGDKVQKGAIIAKAGSGGRDKNNYLHFEIRKGHKPENPLFYLP